MKKKFAFLLMGKEFDTAKDTAVFETEHMISYIFTVTSFEEALKRAVACAEDGVGVFDPQLRAGGEHPLCAGPRQGGFHQPASCAPVQPVPLVQPVPSASYPA